MNPNKGGGGTYLGQGLWGMASAGGMEEGAEELLRGIHVRRRGGHRQVETLSKTSAARGRLSRLFHTFHIRTVTRRVIILFIILSSGHAYHAERQLQSNVLIQPGYAGADTALVLFVELCINPSAV